MYLSQHLSPYFFQNSISKTISLPHSSHPTSFTPSSLPHISHIFHPTSFKTVSLKPLLFPVSLTPSHLNSMCHPHLSQHLSQPIFPAPGLCKNAIQKVSGRRGKNFCPFGYIYIFFIIEKYITIIFTTTYIDKIFIINSLSPWDTKHANSNSLSQPLSTVLAEFCILPFFSYVVVLT